MLRMQHNTADMSLFTQWALALQHVLAIFAGTVLVPLLTGMPVSIAILFAGISTLIFQFFTRFKIPLFFGSSFVFMGVVLLIKQTGISRGMTPEMSLCYASFGVLVSGVIFLIFGQLARHISYKQITKIAPPVLYGSFIVSLGITMVGDTFSQLKNDWLVVHIAIFTTLIVQFLFKGPWKLFPILAGMLAATIACGIEGTLDFSAVEKARWIASPFARQKAALSIFEQFDPSMLGFAIITVLPLVMLSLVEHIANLYAISQTTRVDYIRSVGLPRTLSANGIATILSAMFGGPAATSYTQITGLIVMNKKCAPRLITLASIIMIAISFCPKAGALFYVMPIVVTGAATLIMCGMIIIVGIRSMVASQVNLSNTRNILIFSIMTSLTVGIKFMLHDKVIIWGFTLSALTVTAIVGIVLNMILPNEERVDDSINRSLSNI